MINFLPAYMLRSIARTYKIPVKKANMIAGAGMALSVVAPVAIRAAARTAAGMAVRARVSKHVGQPAAAAARAAVQKSGLAGPIAKAGPILNKAKPAARFVAKHGPFVVGIALSTPMARKGLAGLTLPAALRVVKKGADYVVFRQREALEDRVTAVARRTMTQANRAEKKALAAKQMAEDAAVRLGKEADRIKKQAEKAAQVVARAADSGRATSIRINGKAAVMGVPGRAPKVSAEKSVASKSTAPAPAPTPEKPIARQFTRTVKGKVQTVTRSSEQIAKLESQRATRARSTAGPRPAAPRPTTRRTPPKKPKS